MSRLDHNALLTYQQVGGSPYINGKELGNRYPMASCSWQYAVHAIMQWKLLGDFEQVKLLRTRAKSNCPLYCIDLEEINKIGYPTTDSKIHVLNLKTGYIYT